MPLVTRGSPGQAAALLMIGGVVVVINVRLPNPAMPLKTAVTGTWFSQRGRPVLEAVGRLEGVPGGL